MRYEIEAQTQRSLLTAICQGLSAYQAYLATCRLSSVRSEYLFYEAIARVAQGHDWRPKCEVKLPSISGTSSGDKRRTDFVFSRRDEADLAVEFKYIKNYRPNIKRALENLSAAEHGLRQKAIIVVGSSKFTSNCSINFEEGGFSLLKAKACQMDSKGIRYGAKWFHIERE